MNKSVNLIKTIFLELSFRKLTIVLALLMSFGFSQQGFSQNSKISISKKNVKLSEIIADIERQTQLLFVYDNQVDVNRVVTVNAVNESTESVLKKVLTRLGIKYTVEGRHIVLSASEKEPEHPASSPTAPRGKRVSGQILDENGEPIIGAGVIEKGVPTNGSITDIDGRFSLEVSENAVLSVSFLGYTEQEISTAGRSTINIRMQESAKDLSEVIVVGYGTQRKVNLTGAVNQINADALEDRPVVKLSSALQGAIPNLSVGFSGGAPGQMGSLSVRGYASINGGGSPLVLIDGIPGTLDRLSPEEVQSITVLKDASSAAIYGARGAFGVVLVTTKNGSSGVMKISYNNNVAFSTPTISTDFITTGYDWMKLNDESAAYLGGYSGYSDEDMYQLYLRRNDKTMHPDRKWITIQNRNGRDQYVYYGNYDWWNFLFNKWQNSVNHNINVSGGNQKVNFMVNGNLKTASGIMKLHNDKFNSLALRSKINAQLFPWFRISNNSNLFHSAYNYTGREGGGNANFTNMTVHASPAYSPINPDGTPTYRTGLNGYAIGDGTYPLFYEGLSKGADRKYELTSVTEAVFTPVKDFNITANYSYNLYFSPNFYRQVPASFSLFPGVMEPTPNYNIDRLSERIIFNQVHVVNIYGEYSKKMGEHTAKLTAGFNQEVHLDKTVSAQRDSLLSKTLNDLSLATGPMDMGGGTSSYALRGAFYRINYDYAGKYLLELNGRYDGTSRFPKVRRFGFFPSVSGAWRVSEERFFEPIKKVVNNFKIRGSYGSLGNQNISSPYPYIATMTPNTLSYILDGDKIKYIASPSPVSGNLTWEKVTSTNIGVDLNFFDSRLELNFDRYVRRTLGMLDKGLKLPNVYGATEPRENTADLRTEGFEFSASWQDRIRVMNKPMNYSARFVLSDNYSVITKINNPTKMINSNYEGKRVGEIWGYVTDGYFKTDAEALTYPIDQVWLNRIMTSNNIPLGAGDLRWVDLDGDGKITAGKNTVDDPGDQKVIGNSMPRYSFGLNLSADWNSFDFSVFFQGIGKMNWYPGARADRFWGPFSRPYSSFIPRDFESLVWSPDNPNAYFPRLFTYKALNPNNELYVANNRYLQDLAYVRLKNIMIGYTLPTQFTSKFKVSKMRIYVSGENILTLTKLETKYIDPEQAMADEFGRTYPFSKSYSFGLNINF